MTHKGTQTIDTARLCLRKARMEDAPAMFRNWASDPEVTRFLTWPAHSSREVTAAVLRAWIGEYENPAFYQWMIEWKDTGEAIGAISVVRQRDDLELAEIGYCIGKSWWHSGVMTEALRAVLGFLFSEVGLNRIEARHDIRNPHSGGVMLNCGMQYEGRSRQADRNNQGLCDVDRYAILRSDWAR